MSIVVDNYVFDVGEIIKVYSEVLIHRRSLFSS